ncbi:MAG: ribbon-helix-helix domain-containing protein [Candidatus Helarchaeota archaeon]
MGFELVEDKINSGEFSSRSEVIRYCIRKQYEREQELFYDFKKLEAIVKNKKIQIQMIND